MHEDILWNNIYLGYLKQHPSRFLLNVHENLENVLKIIYTLQIAPTNRVNNYKEVKIICNKIAFEKNAMPPH
jgi:hypothetical protein